MAPPGWNRTSDTRFRNPVRIVSLVVRRARLCCTVQGSARARARLCSGMLGRVEASRQQHVGNRAADERPTERPADKMLVGGG